MLYIAKILPHLTLFITPLTFTNRPVQLPEKQSRNMTRHSPRLVEEIGFFEMNASPCRF